MVHVFFKQNGEYKVRAFFCLKAMFTDTIKSVEALITEYENKNNCSLGDNREVKLLNLPEEFLREKEVTVFESKLEDEVVEEILKSQSIVEI